MDTNQETVFATVGDDDVARLTLRRLPLHCLLPCQPTCHKQPSNIDIQIQIQKYTQNPSTDTNRYKYIQISH